MSLRSQPEGFKRQGRAGIGTDCTHRKARYTAVLNRLATTMMYPGVDRGPLGLPTPGTLSQRPTLVRERKTNALVHGWRERSRRTPG